MKGGELSLVRRSGIKSSSCCQIQAGPRRRRVGVRHIAVNLFAVGGQGSFVTAAVVVGVTARRTRKRTATLIEAAISRDALDWR